MKKKKLYKCREKAPGCYLEYHKINSFQKHCLNPACAFKKVDRDKRNKASIERSKKAAEKRNAVESNMDIRTRLKRAREKSFQPYIRARDLAWFESMGKEPACIMCGKTNADIWHAAHFVSVGSRPELQFHPYNCNLACHQCNFFKAQNDTKYRDNLIAKVGLPLVQYLENYHAVIRWVPEDIEEIRSYYKQLLKRV